MSHPLSPSAISRVHLFEPSGYAGVFQHACRLAQLLTARGVAVVLHTGHQHEPVELQGVRICPCSWWPRRMRRSPLRSIAIASSFVARTLPHLKGAIKPGEVLHVQGIAAAGALTLATLGMGRLVGIRVVYSPHDTFSRRGPIDAALLKVALHVPNALIVNSHKDAEEIARKGLEVHYSPLIQLIPAPKELERQAWRTQWRASETTQVVLFAGCIRPEKRLDLLIESARAWPANRRLAVVGEDRGAWARCARLASNYGIDVAARVEFVTLDEFVAALSAADLVVAPHSKASQSGVLSVARQLGIPTVAASVGGLAELASETFIPGDARDLARAVDSQLSKATLLNVAVDEDLSAQAHLDAYQDRNQSIGERSTA